MTVSLEDRISTKAAKWKQISQNGFIYRSIIHPSGRLAGKPCVRKPADSRLLTPALVPGHHAAGPLLELPNIIYSALNCRVYHSHLNAVSGDARRDEEPTVQAADCGKGWNKINAVNYLAESSIVWLLESLGNWATDILGGLHTVTLAPWLYIYTQVLPR